MKRILVLGLLALGLFGAPGVAGAAPPVSVAELAGLWKAKRWFGPDARGPLTIRRTASTYTASMVGQDLPVRVANQELSFELPRGQGTFRGELTAHGEMLGHWFPPRGVAMGGLITPVRLMPHGANQWSGEVVPFDDVFTFYMLLQPRADGTMSVLLRNQERDWSSLLGPDRLVREGDSLKLIGRPVWQKQEGVVAPGSYDAENQTITLSFPDRGGSYDFRRDDDQSDFYPRGRHPARYVYQPPPARDDGWPTGTLDEVGIDRPAIERMVQKLLEAPMDSATTPKVHAILIARHGKLVLEEYFHGEHRERLHDTRSASKSVSAVLVGAAMLGGAPITLQSPVYQVMNGGSFPPGLDPAKRSMTLEHPLTMSSGYFCDDTNDDAPGNEDKMQEQTEEPDWYRYTLNVPLATPPGEKSVYCSASPNLALGMVARATGESLLHLFQRLIAEPMNIRRYGWWADPAGNFYGGGGMQFLPRDFMKFGQLMLNGGTWQTPDREPRVRRARDHAALPPARTAVRVSLVGSRLPLQGPNRTRLLRGRSGRPVGDRDSLTRSGRRHLRWQLRQSRDVLRPDDGHAPRLAPGGTGAWRRPAGHRRSPRGLPAEARLQGGGGTHPVIALSASRSRRGRDVGSPRRGG